MNLKSLFSLCNATPQHAFNARRHRKRFIRIFFLREMGKKKKDKKKSRERGNPGKGPSIEFFGRSNITIPPGQ